MPNIKQVLYVVDVFKSINKKARRSLLSKDTGYEATNIRYDTEYGSIAKRLSRAKYNSTAYGTNKIEAQHRIYKNSTNSAALIFATGTDMKIGYDAASGVASTIKTGLVSANDFFQTYKDLEYITNGQDSNAVFTFTSYTATYEDMGIKSLTAAAGVVSATTGNLSATVIYALSQQLDSYQEGSVSPSSATVLVNGSQCTVTIPTSANTRCTGRYLYRTQSDGSVLYRLATVTNNTTLVYIDNTADVSLDTTIQGPINYGVPDIYKYICLHKERLFLGWNSTYKSRVIYSDLRSGSSYPDVYPANNYLNFAEDDGDEITFVKEDQFGQLVISKKNSVWMLNTTADSDLSWYIGNSYSNQGCIAPSSAATTPMGIIYLTRYGENRKRLVIWNGNGVQLIPQLEGIEPILTNIADSAIDDIRSHYHNGYYYMAYQDPTAAVGYNDRLLVVDIFNWGISIDKKNIASFSSWNAGTDWGELYTGTSDTTGFIYREDTDLYDLLIRYKSEVDAGTFSQAASAGVEATPSIILTTAISGDVAGRSWASFSGTDTWATASNYNDTWWHCGQWLDDIREVSAKAFSTINWNETKPANTNVLFWIRAGANKTAVEAATFNGPYSDPTGTDISGVTANTYVQMLAKLFTKNYGDYAGVNIYRSGTTDTDYLCKLTASYGVPAEDTIEFDWQSGKIDLGDINEAYKRLRKRIRAVKIEYDRSNTGGNFDFRIYVNGSSSALREFNTSFTDHIRTRKYSYPPVTYCEDFIYQIFSDSDINDLKIRKIIFTLSIEPLSILT